MNKSKANVEALAPDQSSLNAAVKLLKPAKWPVLCCEGDFIWGDCQGSGANPYHVVFDLSNDGYKCTCPSRKFPCKHALALLLIYVDRADDFQKNELPAWVSDWLGRRRQPSSNPKQASEKKNAKLGDVQEDKPKDIDPKKRAAQEKSQAKREADKIISIYAGLEEFETWILDQLSEGILKVLPELSTRCRRIASRLVDAKASALASRVDELPARFMNRPSADQAQIFIDELSSIVLTMQAWRIDPKQSGVARRVTNSETREAVFSSDKAVRKSGAWVVVSSRSQARRDGLIAHETWLLGGEGGQEFAQLLDFVPKSSGASTSGMVLGEIFEAELVFYPSPYPIRALIAERAPTKSSVSWKPVSGIYDQISSAFIQEPWLDRFPVLLSNGQLRRTSDAQWFWQEDSALYRVKNHDVPAIAASVDIESISAVWHLGELDLLAAKTNLGMMYFEA